MNKRILIVFLCLLLFITPAFALFPTPDVNVVAPMAREQFFKKDIILIDLSIVDHDTNASELTIDLNFSTSRTQGTGEVLLDGQNLWTNLTCDSNNLFTEKNCRYVWNTDGVSAGTYFITVQITDNNSSDFNAGALSFNINSTDVNVNISNIGGVINNIGQVVENITFGIQQQGALIGLAIGLTLAIGLFFVLIFSILEVIPRLIGKMRTLK